MVIAAGDTDQKTAAAGEINVRRYSWAGRKRGARSAILKRRPIKPKLAAGAAQCHGVSVAQLGDIADGRRPYGERSSILSWRQAQATEKSLSASSDMAQQTLAAIKACGEVASRLTQSLSVAN